METIIKKSNKAVEKAHPWRRCPIGEHFVKEHLENIPPSKSHPHGIIITRHDHCATNPSDKDELSFDEIQYITETYFSTLPGPPASGKLLKFANADKYDSEIRGWTRYWNEVFKPDVPLDPNLIKALIATESSFDENPKQTKTKVKTVYGLMQIKSDTLSYLGDTKGELKNYLIRLSKSQVLSPSANICAGIRWLFQKKKLATGRLNREPTWFEAIIEYKSYWNDINAKKPVRGMDKLYEYYEVLQR